MLKLAIKGHTTRGKEVIEILEMLGANNKEQLQGTDTIMVYCISSKGYIDILYATSDKNYKVFTLEEFLEKFPYKVGDSVSSKYLKNYKIEKAEWDGHSNKVVYKLQGVGWHSVEDLQPYKKETMEEIDEDSCVYDKLDFTQEPAADKVELILGDYEIKEEDGKTYLVKKQPKYPKTFGECIEKTIDRKYNVEEYLKVWEETDKGLEVVVNDRFELKEDNGKFYIIKKQIQYPNTIEECAELLDTLPHTRNGVSGYYSNLLWRLQQLFICRNAYWKIAGEQMGLGKPWEPDWKDNYQEKWTISFYQGEINLTNGPNVHRILVFPTKEMRDAFYKNFKTLIEQCKELL